MIMHSCGYVAPLLPGMCAAGIDCLQVIEVKAGMDLLGLYRDYGDALSFMGGIDVRVLYNNDRREIDAEKDRAVVQLRREAVDLSLAAASKLIQERLDSSGDRKLVEQFIDSIGKGGA